MNITNNKKWSQLLDSISAYKLFKHPLKNHHIKLALSPVCTLAFAIGKYYKEPIHEGLHIVIAGAGMGDADNKGEGYRVLSKLLGIKNIKLDLVGPDVHKDATHSPHLEIKNSVGEDVDITLFEMTLGAYIKDNKPDLIMLNHPGFESHSEWFNDDEILAAFNLGITLLGVSYGDDEAEFDEYHLRANGFKMSEPTKNPFLLDCANDPNSKEFIKLNPTTFGSEAAMAGMMNWGGKVWYIESKCEKNNELLELLEDRIILNSALGHQLEDPSSLPVKIDIKDSEGGEWFALRFKPELIMYSRDKCLIYAAESQEIICSQVELDSTHLKPKTDKSIFQSLLVSAIISQEYEDEIETFIIEHHDQQEPDEKEFLDMMGMLLGGEKNISSKDKLIQADIPKGAAFLASKYNANDLRSFRSYQNKTLLHYSVEGDDPELFELSKEVDVDPLVRDTDQFSAIDACAANGSIVFFDLIRTNFNVNINERDWRGFSAYNRARVYGQEEMARHIASTGADTSDPKYLL